MRPITIVLFLLINAAAAWCQPGIIHADTFHQEAIIPWFNADSVVFRRPEDSTFQLKLASEVDSFYLRKKGTYVSIPVPAPERKARKFFLRITDGEDYDLYSLEEDTYFITGAEGMRRLSEEASELRQTLEELSGSCEHAGNWARLAKLKERQLAFFTANLDKCRYLLFPCPRFGINVGRAFWRMGPLFRNEASAPGQTLELRYGANYAIGIFGELPVKGPLNEQFHVNIELLFSRQEFGLSRNAETENYSASIAFSRLELPVQVRQFFTVGKVHPFINAGINYVHYLSQNTLEGWATNNGSSWDWQYSESDFFQTGQFGYTFGGGVALPLNYRRMLYLQGRFTAAYDLSGKERFSYHYFTINAGINW